MAFTSVPTTTTGLFWTAAMQNTYLKDNFDDHESRILALESGVVTEYSQSAPQSIANTVAETTLITHELSANWFYDGANWNNVLWFSWVAWMDNNRGGVTNLTVKMKLGSTTLLTSGPHACANANDAFIVVEGRAQATAQSAQRWWFTERYNASTASTRVSPTILENRPTSTEDGSGALNFIITVTMDAASASSISYVDNCWLGGPIKLLTP